MHESGLASKTNSRRLLWVVAGVSALFALLSARPYAGSWNDGSRLASVEAIVDYDTLAIDDSVFLAPIFLPDNAPPPYAPDDALSLKYGTLDRLLIDGHWYSDKPYVPQVMLAGVYKFAQLTTGLQANRHADVFNYLMTVVSSGVSLVAFALAGFIAARRTLGCPIGAAVLTASFTLSTAALAYSRHVNANLPLAACAMVILALLTCSVDEEGQLKLRTRRVAIIGLLAGLTYALESATGGLLCLALGLLLVWQCWLNDRSRWHLPLVLTLTALPLIALHHVFNFRIGGTFGPANANPAYLNWPGSPFAGGELTGQWNHDNVFRAVLYSLELLFGRKGFLWLNPPMLVGAVAAVCLLVAPRRRFAIAGATRGQRAILWCAFGWTAAVWLLYGALSTNRSGVCYSIRWFVPMLAPGLLAVALLLRHRHELWPRFAVFAVAGGVLGAIGWWNGPWAEVRGYLMWPVVGVMMVVWAVMSLREMKRA